MISKVFSIGALIVGGVIIADILTHPTGVAAASSGLNSLWSTSIGGLLGNTATSSTKTVAKK